MVIWTLAVELVCDSCELAANFHDCHSLFGRVREHLWSCGVSLRLDTLVCFMSTLGHSSAIWAHRAQAQKTMRSHDAEGSLPMDMLSLGVIDLDLSISPNAFGLRAFDHEKLLTRIAAGIYAL